MKTLAKQAARFEVKALDESARTFSGLASTWDEDLGGDIIEQGAFKRSLDAWRSSGKVLPLIDQHNYGSIRSVVGKMTAAKETKQGLETDWSVIEGPDGDEVMRRLKGGYIDSLSIGYEAVKWEIEKPEGADPWNYVRHLKEVKLYEVSLVIWPMNPNALIDGDSVKSLTAALREGRLTDEQKAELRALLSDPDSPPEGTPEGKGLAPDDPLRIQMEEQLRAITLRSLAV